MRLRVVCVLALALATIVSAAPENGTEYSITLKDGGKKWAVTAGHAPNAHAWGTYVDTVNVTGWGVLTLETNPQHGDKEVMFAAGYLEAFLTKDLIWANWLNLMQGDNPLPPQIEQFLEQNYAYTMAALDDKAAPEWYWEQVGLVMDQLQGMHAGYNELAHPSRQLSLIELLSLSANGDLSTLQSKFNITNLGSVEAMSHCSSMVVVTPDLSDLYFGHTTWASFTTMLRTYKSYTFPLRANSTGARYMAFSSYPGFLTSTDDAFFMDTGLAVTETTNGNFVPANFEAVTPTTGVLSWARTIVACRVATSGQMWTEVFALANSMTYNNQWIVADYKLFVPGSPLVPGTLWILEQYPVLPGSMSADVTSYLAAGAWKSYNVPFFPQINAACGFPQMVAEYGPYLFSYELCARALIFRRNESDAAASLDGFMRVMRLNNWEHDPFSSGNAGLAISARFDLVTMPPPNEPMLERNAFGGIDSKVTSYALMANGRAASWAQSGPTHDQQPPFSWADWPLVHELMPETFAFDWVLMDLQ